MILNGKYIEQDEPVRVLDFVRSYKLNRHVVAIHINEKKVDKEEFGSTYIHDDDQVTFTSMICGG